MDIKKILNLVSENSKVTNTINESKVVKESTVKKTLKDYFEQVNSAIISEAVPAGMKPMAILDPTNKEAGVGVLTSTNPAVQKMLGGLDPKDVKVVMTKSAAPTSTGSTAKPAAPAAPATGLSTGGGATAMKEEQVDEKWAGDAKVEPTGQYSGKTVEELKSMLAKLKKSGPHELGSPANKRMKQIMFAIRAKKGWKGGVEEAQLDEKAKNPYAIGMATAMKAAGDKPPLKKSTIVKAHDIAKKIMKKEKTDEAEIPSSGPDYGAGIGAGRSATTLESKKVTESMNTLEAAYHEGKSHGLSKHGYACRYNEGSEEHRRYHEGFKEGLDECYGLQPNRGVVDETGMPATVPGMADQAEEADMDEGWKGTALGAGLGAALGGPIGAAAGGIAGDKIGDEMEEGNAFTAALAKTPKGGKFSVGGKTFTDTSSYDSSLDEYAFESLDQKLNALLNEDAEPVAEGVNVSMSQGQGGMHGDKLDDSVSVSATGDDAAKLLAFIKQVGIGGLGGSEAHDAEVHADSHPVSVASDYGAPKFAGHDDMKSLISKVTSVEEDSEEDAEEWHDKDGKVDPHGAYDAGGHYHPERVQEAHACKECGMMESECGCEKEMVDEEETEDQMTDEMAEGQMTDAMADEETEAEEDENLSAKGGATNESVNLGKGKNIANTIQVRKLMSYAFGLKDPIHNNARLANEPNVVYLTFFAPENNADEMKSQVERTLAAAGYDNKVSATGEGRYINIRTVRSPKPAASGITNESSNVANTIQVRKVMRDAFGLTDPIHNNARLANEPNVVYLTFVAQENNADEMKDQVIKALADAGYTNKVSATGEGRYINIRTVRSPKPAASGITNESSNVANTIQVRKLMSDAFGLKDPIHNNARLANEPNVVYLTFSAPENNADEMKDQVIKALADAGYTNKVSATGEGRYINIRTVRSPKPAKGGATSASMQLDEWANEAGKDGTEAAFERDIEFMTKVIAGGLNKPKSTGQTTIPVIAHQDARTGDEDVAAWKKLAGLGK